MMSAERGEIERAIHERFTTLAEQPHNERRFPIGPQSAKRLGYTAEEVDSLPESVTESFAGVGNPHRLGEITSHDVVLDVGCGAGFDSLLAALHAARVIGVDFSEAMLNKASANALCTRRSNVEFRLGRADALPTASESIDVVITNGVFNLCVDKPQVVSEWFRVLKRGGRVQLADICLESHVSQAELAAMGTWSD